jgi:hypothetical protein
MAVLGRLGEALLAHRHDRRAGRAKLDRVDHIAAVRGARGADRAALDLHVCRVGRQAHAQLGRQRRAEVAHLEARAGQQELRLVLARQLGGCAHEPVGGVLRQRGVIDHIGLVGAIGERALGQRANARAEHQRGQLGAAGIGQLAALAEQLARDRRNIVGLAGLLDQYPDFVRH